MRRIKEEKNNPLKYTLNMYAETKGYHLIKTGTNHGDPGWYAHKSQKLGTVAFCWSDDEASAGPGRFWVPGGILLGRGETGLLNEKKRNTLTYASSIEEIELIEKFNPPNKGDIIFNSEPGGDKLFAGWICMNESKLVDVSSRWKPFGRIEGT